MLPFLPLEAEHELIELVLPVWAFPAIATAFFVLITVISWSYRDVAHRHVDTASTDSQDAHH